MSKEKTVFKALRKAPNGRRRSAIVREKGIALRYPLRRAVRAPDGCPPFAFKSLEQAWDFAFKHKSQIEASKHKLEIWECKATGVKPIQRVTCVWYSLESIRQFWKTLKENPLALDKPLPWHLRVGNTPKGTVSCQTIRLVRKVA